jgi:hypothetical protein
MRSLRVVAWLFTLGALGCGVEDAGEVTAALSPPPALRQFAEAVRGASKAARLAGSRSCAAPLPAWPLAPGEAPAKPMRTYVSTVLGLPSTSIDESWQGCGGPGQAPCANIFQNDLFHSDGRMGTALHPLAQQVDRDASGEQVAIFGPVGQRPVVVTAGNAGGWLMGIAFFDQRAECP